jgi:hypothetical protein
VRIVDEESRVDLPDHPRIHRCCEALQRRQVDGLDETSVVRLAAARLDQLSLKQQSDRGVLGIERVHLVQQERHPLALEVPCQELPHHSDDAAQSDVQHSLVQRVLRCEVVEHRRLVRAGRIGDLLHRNAGEPTLREQLRRRVDDRLPPVEALPALTIQW